MSMVQRPRVVADRYRLVQQLGQGGMGRVWLAHDDLLHRDVAIKEIVPPAGLTPAERQEMRDRTLREARAIARLSHPNVVRIFDVLTSDGDPWIVMEYVRGRTLQEILATDGPLPVPRAVDLGLGVLAALRAAHRSGVLHRDVKPGNVLLGEDGRIVLTDFGLATVPGDPVVTRTGLVLGSPAYLAPERAKDGTAGPEADLWSLGATVYAAVEGQSPYARPSAIATLAALATEPPAPPKRAGPLRPVLNGLLRKKPSERISLAEAERLLRRVAGPRSRLELGRAPVPGVRLRRPPGPDTLAAAAGAASAASVRKAAGIGTNAAGPAAPAPTSRTRAAETPSPPAGVPAAGTPAADAPPAATPATTEAPERAGTPPETRAPPQAESLAETEAPEGATTPAEAETATEAETETPSEAEAAEAPAAGVDSAESETAPGDAPATPEAVTAHVPDQVAPTSAAATPATKAGSAPEAGPSSTDERRWASPVGTVVPIVPGPRVPLEHAWGSAAVPVPMKESRTGGPGRRRLWLWAAAAVGVALAVVVAVTAALMVDRDPEGTGGNTGRAPSAGPGGVGAAAPSSDATTPSATQGAATPPAGGGVALPAGWEWYDDQTGFRVAAPKGWEVTRRGTIVYFREPGGGRVLGIDQSDRPKPDPVADWKQQESARVAAGDWNDYHRVRIVSVDYFVKAADWEFTYRASGGRMHVINRGFITSPTQAYAIYWATPESEWSANRENFRLIARSFRPGD
jgi:hypothetical protein